ncbi:MAG TPA: toll/interleukin-1 receptor domain-containing protein, partial [Aggregatilineales bacterium]|nr:toll/interleukin-1 receptor domain-containing protein [Aggregatilineales bacterium]
MPRIFISHASEDDAFVNRLADNLQGIGLSTWVDHFDIPGGKRWFEVIEDALGECDALVFIVSRKGLASRVCGDEWSDALGSGKIVIPIMFENGLEYADLPFGLRSRQAVDFRADYDTGLQRLLKALGVESQSGNPVGAMHASPTVDEPVQPDINNDSPVRAHGGAPLQPADDAESSVGARRASPTVNESVQPTDDTESSVMAHGGAPLPSTKTPPGTDFTLPMLE